MPNVQNMIRLALILRAGVLVVLCCLPLVLAAKFVLAESLGAEIRQEFHWLSHLPQSLAGWQVAAYCGTVVLAFAIFALPLWHLYRLLNRYSEGAFINAETAGILRQIGLGLLLVAAYSFLSHTMQVLILTAENAPGQRSLSISIDQSMVGLLLAGGAVVLVGWIMGQAAEIADENRSFV
ncbi:MAG: DUF2975 domain-containing protein [Pseudomonadota bacterium]